MVSTVVASIQFLDLIPGCPGCSTTTTTTFGKNMQEIGIGVIFNRSGGWWQVMGFSFSNQPNIMANSFRRTNLIKLKDKDKNVQLCRLWCVNQLNTRAVLSSCGLLVQIKNEKQNREAWRWTKRFQRSLNGKSKIFILWSSCLCSAFDPSGHTSLQGVLRNSGWC